MYILLKRAVVGAGQGDEAEETARFTLNLSSKGFWKRVVG